MLAVISLVAALHGSVAVHPAQEYAQALVEQAQLAAVVSDCKAEADAESAKFLLNTPELMNVDFATLPPEKRQQVVMQIQTEGLTVLMVMQQCLFKNWDVSTHTMHPIAVMDIVGRVYVITTDD